MDRRRRYQNERHEKDPVSGHLNEPTAICASGPLEVDWPAFNFQERRMFADGRRPRRWTMIALTLVMAVAWAASRPVGAKAPMNPSLFSGLKWRMLGPFRGGRVDAVSGVRGRPHEFYFGAVNGGVWKTIDAGRIWTPIFDSQPVASIGALAVSNSEPNTIYV